MPKRVAAALATLLLVAACSSTPQQTLAPTPAVTCEPNTSLPPVATIDDINGDGVQGELVLYDYCGSAGGLPPETDVTVPLSADAVNVVISTSEGPPFVAWHATADAVDGSTTSVVLADGRNNEGVQSVRFAGPPAGTWKLTALLTFAGPTGHASYFWQVAAPAR